MREPSKKRERESRRAVSREALAIFEEGRLLSPCTIMNISRSGLALSGLLAADLPTDILVLDVAAKIVFEGMVARRKVDTCGIRLKAAFTLSQLPERLAFVATVRRPGRV